MLAISLFESFKVFLLGDSIIVFDEILKQNMKDVLNQKRNKFR